MSRYLRLLAFEWYFYKIREYSIHINFMCPLVRIGNMEFFLLGKQEATATSDVRCSATQYSVITLHTVCVAQQNISPHLTMA